MSRAQFGNSFESELAIFWGVGDPHTHLSTANSEAIGVLRQTNLTAKSGRASS